MFSRLIQRLLFAVLCFGLLAPAAPAQEAPAEGGSSAAADTARALVEVLQDEAARQALIGELEKLAKDTAPAEKQGGEESAPAEESAAMPESPAGQPSLGRRIADVTQDTAQGIADAATGLWAQIMRAPQTFRGLDGLSDGTVLFDAVRSLILVIVATYAVFLGLRMLARRLFRRMGEAAGEAGPGRTFLLGTGSLLIDAAVVVLAWAAGYAIALMVLGETGQIGIRQTLYLNAFLMVELTRVLIRAVLSPIAAEFRMIDVSDAAARRLTRVLSAITMLLGYGQLLAVPIVNQQASFLAGRAVSAALAAIAVLIAISAVWRYRRSVADWLTGDGEGRIRFRFLEWLVRHWHWPALAYLIWLLIIVVGRPGDMLWPVLIGSAKIAVAILAGMVVTHVTGRAMASGVSLPDPVTQRLPLLERRLNTFVPKALLLLRLVVFAVVVAIAVDVIGVWDIRGWLETEFGVDFAATFVSALMIVLFGFAVWLAMSSWVDWKLNPDFGTAPSSREETLLTLFRNAATIAILVITLMFVLSEIGINIAPLLASAGVLGLAIGFGAQKMVQDIITGVFIQFENAINVGDVITVGGMTGTVERLTIRSVSLRDVHGTYHIIPFSSVDMVSNFMRGFSYSVMDMGVGYQEDVEEVRVAMQDAFDDLKADETHGPKIIGDLEWFGVQSFGDSAVVVRTRIKTRPGDQWGIGRAYNGIVKQVFDARGIEIPYPHQTIYWGEAKEGRTPPLHITTESEERSDGSSGTGKDAKVSGAMPEDADEAGQDR